MVKLTRSAAKDLNALETRLAAQAREIIRRLDAEPHLGKKLQGALAGKRSTRLGRSHRIIYEVRDSDVIVMRIRARKDAYRG